MMAMNCSIFGRLAGDLEDEVIDVGVDDRGTEGVGEPERLHPMFARAVYLTSASSRSIGRSWPRPGRDR